jgi:hypothetical protein
MIMTMNKAATPRSSFMNFLLELDGMFIRIEYGIF